jgi:glycerol-3-phosphate cytidylyltransferase-like family protein
MNTKPRKTAENHVPTVRKTMGGTVAKQQPDTTMTDNNADDSTETTDKDDTPTVNGVELDSVVAVAEAFAYLDDPWIAGDITVRTSEDCSLEDTVRTEEASSLEDLVIIRSRQTHFGHMETLLEAQKQGHISIQHITTGTNRVGNPCLNIEVVGGNDSTETTDKDDTPTVNGVELDSVAGVADALAYLDDPWIAGDITVRTEEASSLEDLVIIRSRQRHFGHVEALLEAQKQGHISIQHITTGTNRVGDPCLNIEVVGGNDSTETTDKDDTPTVNGVELDSVAGVANALAYLDEPYNAGHIAVRSSEDLVIIHSRGACFGHMETLLEAQKQGHISIQHIAVGTNHDSDPCLSIEVVGVDE